MKEDVRDWLRGEARKIACRLEPAQGGREARDEGPEMSARSIQYEVGSRFSAISVGGLGVLVRLAWHVGLVPALHTQLPILKARRPYSESDHVMNIVANVLCGGRVLDDIEIRRNDRAFLDALGARTIPDPTTAGDFCRRFDADHIDLLMTIVNEVRVGVWQQQPASFFEEAARIDADGTLVETDGECKQGMDASYKGVWGYHPLLVSLGNTREPLFIVNRSGNRSSHEGAPQYFDRAVALCRRAGWKKVLLRGDTAFSQTVHFDRWHDDDVRFVFGYDAYKPMIARAENVEADDYRELVRQVERLSFKPRAKQPRVKERIVREREFLNQRLEREDIAEFEHRPNKCKHSYRFVVLRKTVLEEKGQQCLGTKYRYFFYVTNDRDMTAEQVVREANNRCNQENLIEQLKNGTRSLHAPLNTLEANWAYMVIVSIAWSLKAWCALLLRVQPRWREKHQAERERLLRMDFRSFVQRMMLVPAQIIRTGRQIIYRLLAWRPEVPILLRLLDSLD